MGPQSSSVGQEPGRKMPNSGALSLLPQEHVLWKRPGLRVGSEARAQEPGAWQALFNSPAINNTEIILTAAITRHYP